LNGSAGTGKSTEGIFSDKLLGASFPSRNAKDRSDTRFVFDETLKLFNGPRGTLDSFPENTFSIADPIGSRQSFIDARVQFSPEYAAGLDDPDVFTALTASASINATHDRRWNHPGHLWGSPALYPFIVNEPLMTGLRICFHKEDGNTSFSLDAQTELRKSIAAARGERKGSTPRGNLQGHDIAEPNTHIAETGYVQKVSTQQLDRSSPRAWAWEFCVRHSSHPPEKPLEGS